MKNAILKCLSDFSFDDDKFISELNCIIEKEGGEACKVILSALTHIDLAPDQAKDYWEQIVSHRNSMSKALGRGVNLRTAICDYCCTVNKSMTNPIIIETSVLEDVLYALRYNTLTGLSSRRTFDDMFSRETDRATRYGLELSVLFFDLDDFKKINDTFGHLAGDETLKHVARIIMGELRTIDIAVRYGGEEIVVVLPETGKNEAFVVGERIRERVENTRLDHKGQDIRLTISGGIASFPIDAIDTENLIRNSDIAVYKAKKAGKNNIVIFSEHNRRYIRVDFIADIQVQVVDPNNKIGTLKTTSINLSTGGILLESKYPIDIDTKVQLRIPTGTTDKPLVIIGNVVRVEKISSIRYEVGISFFGVDYASRNILSRCIRKRIEKKE